MSVYLLHIEPAYRHARHYVGWTEEHTVTHRVNQHLSGGCKATPLVIAALMAGSRVTLARAWEGAAFDRAFERKLKERGGASRARRCPLCRQQIRKGGHA
jgi:hypothetical protein